MNACGGCGETDPAKRCIGCLAPFGSSVKKQPTIKIEPFVQPQSPSLRKFQASIWTQNGGFHHGIGDTEAEALVMASLHWLKINTAEAAYDKGRSDGYSEGQSDAE